MQDLAEGLLLMGKNQAHKQAQAAKGGGGQGGDLGPADDGKVRMYSGGKNINAKRQRVDEGRALVSLLDEARQALHLFLHTLTSFLSSVYGGDGSRGACRLTVPFTVLNGTRLG